MSISACKLLNGTAHCPAGCGKRCHGIAERAAIPVVSQALDAVERESNGAAHATWTLTDPPFIMSIDVKDRKTRGRVRSEVSHSVHLTGFYEIRYTAYWTMLTSKCCAAGGLVLDSMSSSSEPLFPRVL